MPNETGSPDYWENYYNPEGFFGPGGQNAYDAWGWRAGNQGIGQGLQGAPWWASGERLGEANAYRSSIDTPWGQFLGYGNAGNGSSNMFLDPSVFMRGMGMGQWQGTPWGGGGGGGQQQQWGGWGGYTPPAWQQGSSWNPTPYQGKDLGPVGGGWQPGKFTGQQVSGNYGNFNITPYESKAPDMRGLEKFQGGSYQAPGMWTGGSMEAPKSNVDPMNAIEANIPYLTEQRDRGFADAAARFGQSGMLASSPCMEALGGVQRHSAEDLDRIAMDYRVNAAEAQAARDLAAQQNQMNRELEAWNTAGQWQHEGQLSDLDRQLQAWGTYGNWQNQANQQANQNDFNAWNAQNQMGLQKFGMMGDWRQQAELANQQQAFDAWNAANQMGLQQYGLEGGWNQQRDLANMQNQYDAWNQMNQLGMQKYGMEGDWNQQRNLANLQNDYNWQSQGRQQQFDWNTMNQNLQYQAWALMQQLGLENSQANQQLMMSLLPMIFGSLGLGG